MCRRKGLDVRGSVQDLDSGARFDIIVMLDVIEHLASPLEILASLREMMPSGGLLLLTTGDWGSLLARLMGRNWRLMTPPQHLWFFTQRSLRQILSNAGFEVESMYHPWKIVPLDLAFYQLTQRLGVAPSSKPSWMARIGVPVNLFDAVSVTAVAR